MITRMETKGLLRFEEGGRAKLIYPAVTREEVASQETASLVDRMFGGSVTSLVAQFFSSRSVSQQEIDELYELLKSAEPDDDK